MTLRDQAGVIARQQALEGGLTKSDIDRLVRRREWVRLLPGVYVDHTGEPTWLQRAWAGVLSCAPAALAGSSALRATAGPGWRPHDDAGPVWIAVGSERNVTERPGYRVRYLVDYEDQVLSHTHPPRMRFEEACLDVVATTRSPLDRIQLLAGACQSRRTTAQRLRTSTLSSTGCWTTRLRPRAMPISNATWKPPSMVREPSASAGARSSEDRAARRARSASCLRHAVGQEPCGRADRTARPREV